MGSESDDKTRKSPHEQKKGRVVEDERGHQIWEGTIRTVKLSLMKTGLFYKTEAQQRLMELGEAKTDDAGNPLDEDLELTDDGGDDGDGYNPYDSTK